MIGVLCWVLGLVADEVKTLPHAVHQPRRAPPVRLPGPNPASPPMNLARAVLLDQLGRADAWLGIGFVNISTIGWWQ